MGRLWQRNRLVAPGSAYCGAETSGRTLMPPTAGVIECDTAAWDDPAVSAAATAAAAITASPSARLGRRSFCFISSLFLLTQSAETRAPRTCGGTSCSRSHKPARGMLPETSSGGVRLGHRAVVEGLVEDRLLDALLPRDLAQRAPRRGGLLDDLGRRVVADVRVERRRRRERQLGVALAVLAVRREPVDALLGEEPASAGEQLHGVEDVAGEQRHEDVELEVALHAADRDRGVVPDHLRGDLRDDLRHDGVDLARHDRAALLQ